MQPLLTRAEKPVLYSCQCERSLMQPQRDWVIRDILSVATKASDACPTCAANPASSCDRVSCLVS